jgi:tetratricopeptide (TPR) repeat protein
MAMVINDKPNDDESAAEQPTAPQSAGNGRYIIQEYLGGGSMGVVYRAFDSTLRRTVALKRIASHLRNDPSFRRRFANEAKRSCQLNDVNIASVYDFFEDGPELYLVMEHIDGETLRKRLKRRMTVEEFFPIAIQCANGLVAAEEKSIVHCDIKPDNIMLTKKGVVKILDFGVAKRLPEVDPVADTVASPDESGQGGTPAYMAPEVLQGKGLSSQVDLYALGVVSYECLTGGNPFAGGTVYEVYERVIHHTPPNPSEVQKTIPRQLDRVIRKAITKDRSDRYGTATELFEAFQRTREDLAEEQRKREERKRRLVHLGAVLGTALLVTGLMLSIPPSREFILRMVGLIPPLPKQVQLAVMPFTNAGADDEMVAYARGLHETVTDQLVTLGHSNEYFEVVDRREFDRSDTETIEDARKQLGVNTVMTGEILLEGEGSRLILRLFDGTSGRRIRSKSFKLPEDHDLPSSTITIQTAEMLDMDLSPEARMYLSQSAPAIPQAEDFYLQGRGYLRDYDDPKNIDDAIRVFEHALSLDPDYALAHAGLGEAYWHKFIFTKDRSWIERARTTCEQSLALDEGLALGHTGLGQIHMGMGQYEGAASEFMTAIELDPQSYDAYRGLAAAHQEMDQPAEAEGAFRQAIQLHPEYWGGYSWLGAFYARRGQFADAAEMFRQVVALAPDNARGYSNLGGTYHYLERYDDAVEMYETSIEIRPTNRAYNNLGALYHTLQQYPEAAETYLKALDIDDTKHRTWRNLAIAYKGAGMRDEMTRAFREAAVRAEELLELNPRDPMLRARLAEFYAGIGDKEVMLRHASVALEEGGEEPEILVTIAGVYEDFGMVEEAVGFLVQAIDMGYPGEQLVDNPGYVELMDDARVQAAMNERDSRTD